MANIGRKRIGIGESIGKEIEIGHGEGDGRLVVCRIVGEKRNEL
jgi:hypothetical protein